MLLRAEWKWHGRPSCLPSNTNAGPSKFAWKLTGYAVALWGRDRSLELHVVSNDNDWCNSPKPLHSTIEFRTMMTSQWDNWTAPPSLSTASRKPASGSIGNYKINVCEMAAVRGVTASMECPQQRFYQHVISNSTAWLSNHECLDMKVYPTNQGTHIQEKTPCLSLRLPIAELPSRDLMDWGAVETRPAKKWHSLIHQGIQAVSSFNEHLLYSRMFSHIMSASWKSRTHRKRQGRTFAPCFRPGWLRARPNFKIRQIKIICPSLT